MTDSEQWSAEERLTIGRRAREVMFIARFAVKLFVIALLPKTKAQFSANKRMIRLVNPRDQGTSFKHGTSNV